MKKKLHEIFDEATPGELDQFLKENDELTLDSEVLSSVKNKVHTQIQKYYCNQEKGRIIKMKKEKSFKRVGRGIFAGVVCAAMMLCCFAGYQGLFNQSTAVPTPTFTESQIIATTVTLDVNPSIEIKADQDEKVLDVIALNKDAEIVLEGVEVEGEGLDRTINAIVGSMIENGYLNKTTNSVLLSVESKNESLGNTIKNKLSEEISNLLTTENITGSVISQTVSGDDEELRALATQYGITVGKAKLIQTIVKMGTDRKFADYAGMTITELNDVMNASTEGSTPENTYIGEEKALEIALNKLDLTVSQLASQPEIELVASRGDICYMVKVRSKRQEGNGAVSSSYVVYVNAFTGKLSGEDVKEPNFTEDEAWSFVCEQLGSDGEKPVLVSCEFNNMESGLPMTYRIFFEIGEDKYVALVDAMSGVVIRTQSMNF